MEPPGELTVGYDSNGNRAEIGYPGGVTARLTHDFADREASLEIQVGSSAPQAIVAGASYKPFGPLAGFTFGNGLAELRSFNQRYFPSRIEVSGRLDQAYSTDQEGNILTMNRAVGTEQFPMAYAYQDPQYFLTQGNGPWGLREWVYDRIGNRLHTSPVLNGYKFAFLLPLPLCILAAPAARDLFSRAKTASARGRWIAIATAAGLFGAVLFQTIESIRSTKLLNTVAADTMGVVGTLAEAPRQCPGSARFGKHSARIHAAPGLCGAMVPDTELQHACGALRATDLSSRLGRTTALPGSRPADPLSRGAGRTRGSDRNATGRTRIRAAAPRSVGAAGSALTRW